MGRQTGESQIGLSVVVPKLCGVYLDAVFWPRLQSSQVRSGHIELPVSLGFSISCWGFVCVIRKWQNAVF